MSLTDKSVEGNKSAFFSAKRAVGRCKTERELHHKSSRSFRSKGVLPSKRGRVLPLQREALIDVGERVF